MSIERHVNNRHQWKSIWIAIGLFLLAAWNTPLTNAQQSSDSSGASGEISFNDLYRAPGELLVKGSNMTPIGPLKVKTYRLEEIKLPQPLQLNIQGRKERIVSAVRLTITGESFPPGNYTIWINDESLDNLSFQRTKLIAVIFDPTILENGASISISRDNAEDPTSRSTLPEQLQLPARLQSNRASNYSNANTIRIRRIMSSSLQPGKPEVEISVTSDEVFPITNQTLVLQIGDQEIVGGGLSPTGDGDLHTMSFTLTADQFGQLKDGDQIKVKYGRGARSGRKFGALNKSLLEK